MRDPTAEHPPSNTKNISKPIAKDHAIRHVSTKKHGHPSNTPEHLQIDMWNNAMQILAIHFIKNYNFLSFFITSNNPHVREKNYQHKLTK